MPPSSRADAGARLDRRRRALAHAAIVTGFTTAATGCAHSLAGGTSPSLLMLSAAFMATLVVLAPVLGAAASWPRRVVAVTIAQTIQHGLYSLPQPSSSSTSTHAHHAVETITTTTAHVASHAHGDMLLAHVLAGVVTLAVLSIGASVVGAVLRALRGDRLVQLVALVVPLGVTRPASVTCARPIVRVPAPVLRTPVARRGPPLLAV